MHRHALIVIGMVLALAGCSQDPAPGTGEETAQQDSGSQPGGLGTESGAVEPVDSALSGSDAAPSDTIDAASSDTNDGISSDTGDGVPSETEPETVTIEEAGVCAFGGWLEADHTGFGGAGYINTENAVGASITWQVAVAASGPVILSWRYALAAGARPAQVAVDGQAGVEVAFGATGAWDAWDTAQVQVDMTRGVHTVVLSATGPEGLANIDALTVTGPGAQVAPCPEDSDTPVPPTDTAPVDTGSDSVTMPVDSGSDSATVPDTGSADTDVCQPPRSGLYQMERLDRGVVAVRVSGGVYVGWRMMGWEYDPDNPGRVAYTVYRDGTAVATVTDSTNYVDSGGSAGSRYAVAAVIDGTPCPPSDPVGVWTQNYVRIPLDPPGDYEANDASPGDLDGDGRYEIVLEWQPYDSKDNSQSGVTSPTYLDALTLDGRRLWRIDLGINIRSGAHYTQFSVYDFDGDGKAEVACKTAPGTRDGLGNYLSTGPAANDDDGADYRNGSGYVLSGPEYFTVFDGETGAELATIDFPVPRGNVSSWGDGYGNRVDRFNGGVSFVADQGVTASGRPSIIHQRGYYTRMTVSAMTFRNGVLDVLWVYDSDKDPGAAGQGNHSIMTIDADGDGAMEIITGSATIDSNGALQCTTGMGHGDALHVGELVRGQRPTVFTVHEGRGGHDVHYADDCDFVYNVTGGDDNGRGVAEYVGPQNSNAASCGSATGGDVFCDSGTGSAPSPGRNFLIYWDGDRWRETLDRNHVDKPGVGRLLTADGCSANNGTKATPSLTADLLGDWREELVLRESDNRALRVYTTTDVTDFRMYTLMHDPTYRMQVTMEQSSYNQPPHLPFAMGEGFPPPPRPDIFVP